MLQKINEFRRTLTKMLTSGVQQNKYINSNVPIKKILIVRTNHRLGNILLITPLIEEIVSQFPDAEIDLFVKGGISEVIFDKHEKIKSILFLPKNHFSKFGNYLQTWFKVVFKKYDLVVNANAESSSGRLATKFSRSKFKFYGTETPNSFIIREDYGHFAKNIVYNFRAYLLKSNLNGQESSISPLKLILSNEEIFSGSQILSAITQNNKKTICFFTYATGGKCYGPEFWDEMYLKMGKEFGENYNLLEVLPMENISQINFKSKNYYSKDIREIASLLHRVELFIGADSGMMHLASTATKTIGLFKGNSIQRYDPYGFPNQGIDTNTKTLNEIIEIMKSKLN